MYASRSHLPWLFLLVALVSLGCDATVTEGGGRDALLDMGDAVGGCACVGGEICCDGVCVNLASDAAHCGACGAACPAGELCDAGTCFCEPPAGVQARSCNILAGESCCPSLGCVELRTQAAACGACGDACSAGESCEEAACSCGGGLACPRDTVCCGGACCGLGESCCGGQCTPSGDIACQCGAGPACAGDTVCCDQTAGASCVALTQSRDHCGACGRVCATNQVCALGKCACATGFMDCDQDPANGCETPATSDKVCPNACGDGRCEGNEDCTSCPTDCASCCGDGACEGDESCASCPGDCGVCCGNGACDAGETCSTCPADCGSCCGNGTCGSGETCSTCPADCGACCGDGACGNGETCGNCPLDCGACCGNGACGGGETCTSCPQDCGTCPPVDACGGCPAGQSCLTTGGTSFCSTCSPSDCSAFGVICCPGNTLGNCTNQYTDANNCGTCGSKCPSGQNCVTHFDPLVGPFCTSCSPTDCAAFGVICCPGNTAGNCTNQYTDVNNCGSCGRKCAVGQSCNNGVCG